MPAQGQGGAGGPGLELEHILFRLHNRVSKSAASIFDPGVRCCRGHRTLLPATIPPPPPTNTTPATAQARRLIAWVLIALTVLTFAIFGLLHVRYVRCAPLCPPPSALAPTTHPCSPLCSRVAVFPTTASPAP